MTNVFVDCLRIDGSIRCPGDGGFSEVIVFGRHVRLRKDHPAIELMGRLDELEALAEWGLQEIGSDEFRIIAAMTAALNTYLATGGDDHWLRPVKEVINKACELDSKELGWFIPSDRTTALLNLLRVKAREAERTAVKLLDDDLPINKVNELIGMLNQLNKYIAHLIFLSNVHVFKNVNDKIRTLLGNGFP